MKTLLIFILIALTVPSFGQTKTDFLSCLDLIFSQEEFQPAFTNDPATSGDLIIVSREAYLRQNSIPVIHQIQQSLTQDDFWDFDHNVQVVREQDLETVGISENAILNILAGGNDSAMKIRLISNIKYENLTYFWSYNLIKVEDAWEITGNSLSKQSNNITNW